MEATDCNAQDGISLLKRPLLDSRDNAVIASRYSLFPDRKGLATKIAKTGEVMDEAEVGEDSTRPLLLRINQLEHDLGTTAISLELAVMELKLAKQNQADLNKSVSYMQAVFESVPSLLILDSGLRVVKANQSFYAHFKVTRDQTENRLVYELGNGQWDIPRLRVLLEEILPRNSFFKDFEISHTFPELGSRTILLSAQRVDHLQQILLNIEDVTERLHYQSEMRRSESRYRRLFETAKDGILILDPLTAKITDCNPFIEELLNSSRNELVGKELWEIGILKDQNASREAFAILAEKGYMRYEHLPVISKAGLHRDVEFVSNVYFESGLRVIQCNIRDISIRKKTERELGLAKEEISRQTTTLQEHVEERTARLKEIIGELEMFSYAVAHDMRAPLRAMEGYANILMEDFGVNLPIEGQGHLRYIMAAAVRLDSLIQDVLTYSTVLHTDMKLSILDLNTLVQQIILTYPQLHSGSVAVKIIGTLPKISGHPAAVSQCISNVLTNAAKFVATGTAPRITIRAEELNGYVRLWVEDNGIGIDPKDQKRIFGMFERVTNTYEGNGIGLAIVRKSIQRLQGNAGVESSLGNGSKFWLEFKPATSRTRVPVSTFAAQSSNMARCS